MKQLIISLAIAIGALVPAFAFAQSTSAGLLTVYVQVINNTGATYYQYQAPSPSAFTVAVSGQSPSLSNFPGSQSGTTVSLLAGSYNVTIANVQNGYAPSYSIGCNSTIAAGQSQTCVVTMTPSYAYNQYATPYQYQNYQPLTCQTVTPTVGLGQQASFNAVGGQGGTYNWSTAYQNFPNVGPTLTTSFQASGSQVVTVTNASQTATCNVNVTNAYTPAPTTYPYGYNGVTYPSTYSNTYPTYTSVAYPQLPRTGFGPKDMATGAAFAVVLLIAAGVVVAPYVRKTVTTLSR